MKEFHSHGSSKMKIDMLTCIIFIKLLKSTEHKDVLMNQIPDRDEPLIRYQSATSTPGIKGLVWE